MSQVIGYIEPGDPDGNEIDSNNSNSNSNSNSNNINNSNNSISNNSNIIYNSSNSINNNNNNNINNSSNSINLFSSNDHNDFNSRYVSSSNGIFMNTSSNHLHHQQTQHQHQHQQYYPSSSRSINNSAEFDENNSSFIINEEDYEDYEEDDDDEDDDDIYEGLDEKDLENINIYLRNIELSTSGKSVNNSNNNSVNNSIDYSLNNSNNNNSIYNSNNSNNNNNTEEERNILLDSNNGEPVQVPLSNNMIQIFSNYTQDDISNNNNNNIEQQELQHQQQHHQQYEHHHQQHNQYNDNKKQETFSLSFQTSNNHSTELDLSEQELDVFPWLDPSAIQSYKIIDLSFNNISSIPLDSFDNLIKLQQLIMFNNNIRSLPPTIETLRHLTILDLSHNQIEELCREIGNLSSLRELYLSNNSLKKFPTTGNLNSLKKLILDNNQIHTIPPECLEPLVQLQTLDMSFNNLDNLSSCISRLKNLKQLNLSHNQLVELPSSVRHLTKLHSLALDYNQIVSIPDKVVANLSRLAKLTISNNKLRSLPYSINNLDALIELNVSHNQIEHLPESICFCSNIKKLNLTNNNLKELPSNIGFLQKLVDLQIYNNQISSFPQSFLKCRAIREIGIDGNPLPSFYHLGIRAIRYHIKNPNCDDHMMDFDSTSSPIIPAGEGGFIDDDQSSICSSTSINDSGNIALFKDSGSLEFVPTTTTTVNIPTSVLEKQNSFKFVSSNPRSVTESDIKFKQHLKQQMQDNNNSNHISGIVELEISSSNNNNNDDGKEVVNLFNNQESSSTAITTTTPIKDQVDESVINSIGSAGVIDAPTTPPMRFSNSISPPRTIKYAWEIDFNELEIGELIGQGGFSKVYHGYWRNKEVAIKQLELQSNKTLDDFRREVGILSKLKPHENLLYYYGACKQGSYCYIVTEYLPRGSLHDLLHREGTKGLIRLDLHQILSFAIGVALGCYLLSTYEPPIYHTDLKTKNLLVTNNLKIKIADFGLASFAKRKDASGADQNRLAYAFYAAPEILNSKPFSEKSDVFSFGTILWELITNQIPYNGMDPYHVKDLLKSGKRLDIPDNCHEVFKCIITDCWNHQSDERPTFLTIYHRLDNLMKSIKK